MLNYRAFLHIDILRASVLSFTFVKMIPQKTRSLHNCPTRKSYFALILKNIVSNSSQNAKLQSSIPLDQRVIARTLRPMKFCLALVQPKGMPRLVFTNLLPRSSLVHFALLWQSDLRLCFPSHWSSLIEDSTLQLASKVEIFLQHSPDLNRWWFFRTSHWKRKSAQEHHLDLQDQNTVKSFKNNRPSEAILWGLWVSACREEQV